MEIAGLALGLASLYGACIETVHRVESYKNFQSDARQLSAQFRADRAILQRWAEKVGISHDGLSETYDRRLDGSEIGSAVREILLSLQTLLKATEGAQGKIHHDSAGKSSSTRQLISVQDATGPTPFPSRKRDRVAWTFGGKEKFATLVDSFCALVGKLNDLIPIEVGLEQRTSAEPSPQVGSEDLSQYRLLVEKALQRFKNEDMREFLLWIGPVPDSERYESCRACRTPNTCSWILERPSFLEWMSSSFPDDWPKFLWIHGPAGYGKSVICAAVVDHIRQDGPLRVAHHFLSSSPDHRNDITVVLRSWLAQMIEAEDQLLDTALDEVRKAPLGAARSNLWTLFTTLVREHSGWTFVLDGLDEFGFLYDSGKQDPGREQAVFLRDLQKAVLGTRNRVLVASRDELEIRLCLSAAGGPVNGLSMYEHQVSAADVEDDILAFSTDVVASKLTNKSESVRAEIAETMAAKCEGMFLWIDLHRHDLRKGKNKLQLQKAIEEMPIGLDSIYERNWNNIARLPGHDRSRALSILRWATSAVRPLTVAELTEALLVSNDEEAVDLQLDDLPDAIDNEYIASEISGLCGSLVEVSRTSPDQPPKLRMVQLRHFSVRQFLLTRNVEMELPGSDTDVRTFSRTENNRLAVICLRYLRSPSVQGDLRSQSSKRRFANYAVQYWPRHVSRQGLGYGDVSQIATDFFTSDTPAWTTWRSRFHDLQCLEDQEKESGEVVEMNGSGDSDGQELPSPMYYAALFGLRPTIEHLHSKTPDSINDVGGIHGTPIKAAYAAGYSSLVKHMAKLGADLSISAGCHGSLLGCACHSGDLQLCRFLLDQDVSLEAVDGLKRTPLYTACYHGHADILKLLVERGAEVAVVDAYKHTPINAASSAGHTEVVKRLLEYGADLNLAQEDGMTPLYSACLDGHSEVVQLLLEHRADVSVPNTHGWTPINVASSEGHVEIVKQLLKYNADVSIAEEEGDTPLFSACMNGYSEVVQLLLKHGADVSVPDTYQWTPLNAASAHGYADTVKQLLEYKADTSAVNERRETPLHTASDNGHVDVVKLLLEHGADTSVTDDWGRTPLYIAAQRGHVDIAKLHLEYKADPSIANNKGWTPLYMASNKGRVDVVKLLLEYKADPCIPNNEGWTPLHNASDKGHVHIAKYLLAEGSDPRSVTRLSETSLHLASRRDLVEMVDLLAAQGYDAEQMDDYGRTCLDWASMCPHLVSSRKWVSEGVSTPKATSQRILRRTIARLVDQAISEKTTAFFYVLGRCLLLTGDETNASFALQQGFLVYCDRCGSQKSIVRDHYACRSCADIDLCGVCFRVFRKDEKPWRCHSHEFIQIPHDDSVTTPHDWPGLGWPEWLIAMREQIERPPD